jgi:serine O-acetyltransferase
LSSKEGSVESKQIGEGMIIIHGFSTAIGAESIGKNCIIYQQVTIGATKDGFPTILDNVTIYAGAVIIGKITIGNNVVVGANATVFNDVPDNCTVLPGSSRVMKWRKRDTLEDSVS